MARIKSPQPKLKLHYAHKLKANLQPKNMKMLPSHTGRESDTVMPDSDDVNSTVLSSFNYTHGEKLLNKQETGCQRPKPI